VVQYLSKNKSHHFKKKKKNQKLQHYDPPPSWFRTWKAIGGATLKPFPIEQNQIQCSAYERKKEKFGYWWFINVKHIKKIKLNHANLSFPLHFFFPFLQQAISFTK
jgi:hypothetical protein